jgi:hypothetical protein
MKLSMAIRLGAMLRPQSFGTAFEGIGVFQSNSRVISP